MLTAAARLTRAPRHKGFGTVVSLTGRYLFPASTRVTFTFDDGRVLPVAAADRYWMRLLLESWHYEPDTEWVLRRALGPDVLFVDAGANIGYWSALGRVLCGPGRVVAIEASAATYGRLTATARVNGASFETVHAAVWDRSGEVLDLAFDADRHGRASVHEVTGRSLAVTGVRSATIDEVVAAHGDPSARVVIKLDVEGAEVRALQGAARTLAGGALVVYEDHGRDRSHAVSRYLIDELGIDVAWIDADEGRIDVIRDVGELSARKVATWKGYNLVAGNLEVLR